MSIREHRQRLLSQIETETRIKGLRIYNRLMDSLSHQGEPKPGAPPREITGEYRDSFTLSHQVRDGRITETISTDHPEAIPLEFGTSKTDPHPHMRPSLRGIR